jgi:hypothetical protein
MKLPVAALTCDEIRTARLFSKIITIGAILCLVAHVVAGGCASWPSNCLNMVRPAYVAFWMLSLQTEEDLAIDFMRGFTGALQGSNGCCRYLYRDQSSKLPLDPKDDVTEASIL